MLDNTKSEKEWKSYIRKFSVSPEHKKGHKELLDDLKGLVLNSIKASLPNEKFGILFSGGVDSTLIAKVCKGNKSSFICYTSALEEKSLEPAEDLAYAKKAAKQFGFKLKIRTIGLKETEKYIKKILDIIKEPNVVKVGVALPFYIAYEMAKKDKINIMFSGLGSEELFAGYKRHLTAKDINKECFEGLLGMYERDLTRDLAVAKALKIDLRVPYLDKGLIEYSLKIPAEFKLKNGQNKLMIPLLQLLEPFHLLKATFFVDDLSLLDSVAVYEALAFF